VVGNVDVIERKIYMEKLTKCFGISSETVESLDIECGACNCSCPVECGCWGDPAIFTDIYYHHGTTNFYAINGVVSYQPMA